MCDILNSIIIRNRFCLMIQGDLYLKYRIDAATFLFFFLDFRFCFYNTIDKYIFKFKFKWMTEYFGSMLP